MDDLVFLGVDKEDRIVSGGRSITAGGLVISAAPAGIGVIGVIRVGVLVMIGGDGQSCGGVDGTVAGVVGRWNTDRAIAAKGAVDSIIDMVIQASTQLVGA